VLYNNIALLINSNLMGAIHITDYIGRR